MRQKSNTPETPSERLVRDIRRATRKQYSAEEKIRIVLDGLRGEVTIAELCLHPRFKTPHVAILAGGAVGILAIFSDNLIVIGGQPWLRLMN
jgi:hypothetical protein